MIVVKINIDLNEIFKGIREGKSRYSQFSLILSSFILTKVQVAFYIFFKIKMIFEIQPVKVGDYNKFLMGAAN